MIWLAVGLGCIWHGGQIVWVAPTPRILQKRAQSTQAQPSQAQPAGAEADPARAFQLFWLDQYAWIGIALVGIGLVCCVAGLH